MYAFYKLYILFFRNPAEDPAAVESKQEVASSTTDTSSNISSSASLSSVTIPSPAAGNDLNNVRSIKRNIKSALNTRPVQAKVHSRAATAKPKKQASPQSSSAGREREQG